MIDNTTEKTKIVTMKIKIIVDGKNHCGSYCDWRSFNDHNHHWSCRLFGWVLSIKGDGRLLRCQDCKDTDKKK